MKYKLKEAPQKSAKENECRHYWVIEDAEGPTSRGVCKFCGAEREFYNSWPDSGSVGRDTRVLELPDLLNAESEGGGKDSELERSSARL
jgi:hypothetical protein